MSYEVVSDLGIVLFQTISLSSARLFCDKNDLDYRAIKEVCPK